MLELAWRRWMPRLMLAVVAGAIPTLTTVAPALDDAPPHVLEIEMASSVGGALQVFYDLGSGFREANSAVVPIAPADLPQTYRLPLPHGRYHWVRIDPNDRPGSYVFTSLRILTGAGAEVRRIPLDEIQAAGEVTLEPGDGRLTAITTPDASDPQLLYEPTGVLVLAPERADLSGAGVKGGMVALTVLLLAFLLDRSGAGSAACPALVRFCRIRPYRAVVLAGLLGTLAATYPLLLGRSLVAPGNGPSHLLYDHPPYSAGASDPVAESARGTDVGAMMWAILPYTVVQREALAHREFPLWNRYNAIGEPLWGQAQTFFLDPFHLASLAIPDPAVAMDLRFLVGRAVFAIGSGIAVALVTGNGLAAVIVALLAPFVGHFTARFNHPAYFSIVYAPWILVAYAWLARATGPHRGRAAALLAAVTWLQLVGSTPKEGVVALIAAHAAGMLGLVAGPGPWKDRVGRLSLGVAGGLIALLLGAPHWLVFLDTLGRSWTAYDQPVALLADWPQIVGYVLGGAAPGVPVTGANPLLVMAALCALAYPKQLAASGLGLGALLAGAGVAAIAIGLVPAAILVTLPLVGNIHHVGNSFLGATVAPLLLVAGVGLAGMLEEAARGPAVRLTIAVAVATVLLTAMAPGGAFELTTIVGMGSIVCAAGMLLTMALVFPAPTPSGVMAAVLAGYAAVFASGLQMETGVGALDALLIQPRPRADLQATSPALEALRADAGTDPYRVAPIKGVLMPGTQGYWKLEATGGPDALRLPAIESLSDAVGLERTSWLWLTVLNPEMPPAIARYLDLLNVKYLLARADHVPAGSTLVPFEGRDHIQVIARQTAWPRAFVTAGVERHRDVNDFAARLQASTGPFSSVDEQDVAAVRAVSGLPRSGPSTAATDVRLTPNTTTFRVETAGPALAVLSEGYVEKDFRVTVNGQNSAYIRVNQALKGVVIPGPGRWDVRFEYRPALWGWSWLLAALGLAWFAGMLLARPLQ